MFHLIFIFLLNIIYTLKTSPNDYKELDNPYENDIESQTEDYNNIIEAVAVQEYDDYYKGVYYKNGLCCYRTNHNSNFYSCSSNYKTLTDYAKLTNINDTNLKKLHYNGCKSSRDEINILFYYKRNIPDALVTVKIRLTNEYQEPLKFLLGTCNRYIENENNEYI